MNQSGTSSDPHAGQPVRAWGAPLEEARALLILLHGEGGSGAEMRPLAIALHEVSPLREHPVDLVLWVPAHEVEANDYNPNTVAVPEMRLLETSIEADGYTQPVVTWLDGDRRETVDGFHRGEVGVGHWPPPRALAVVGRVPGQGGPGPAREQPREGGGA